MWLEGSALRLPVILLFIWKNLGFAVIIFLSALQAIPQPLYEYAALEGAGFWKQTFGITLPMIVPSAFLVIILEWINAFKIFKEVYFIGGAYPDESVYTLQNYMNNMFSKLNYQNVTTAAYSFAVIVFVLFGVLFWTQRRLMKTLT
jgi:multiple sugar transport system permease protein